MVAAMGMVSTHAQTILRATPQRASDDAHGLWRVVAAMADGIGGGGKKLPLAEKFVHPARRGPHEDPVNGYHERPSQDQADHGRGHYEDAGLDPAVRFEDSEKAAVGGDGCATVSADERVRTRSRQA